MGCATSSSSSRVATRTASGMREPTSTHHDPPSEVNVEANVDTTSSIFPSSRRDRRDSEATRGRSFWLSDVSDAQEGSSDTMLAVVAAGGMCPLATSEPPLPNTRGPAEHDIPGAAVVNEAEDGTDGRLRPSGSISAASPEASVVTRISTPPLSQFDLAEASPRLAEGSDVCIGVEPPRPRQRPQLVLAVVSQPSLGGSSATSDINTVVPNNNTRGDPAGALSSCNDPTGAAVVAPPPMCGLELLPIVGTAYAADHPRRRRPLAHDSLAAEGSGSSEGFVAVKCGSVGMVTSGDGAAASSTWCMMEGDRGKTPVNSAIGDVPLFDGGEEGSDVSTRNGSLLTRTSQLFTSEPHSANDERQGHDE